MRLDHLLSKENSQSEKGWICPMVRLIGGVNDTLFNLEGTHSHPSKDEDKRGYSLAGRAPALQAGGQRFDPAYLHQFDGLIAQLVRASA